MGHCRSAPERVECRGMGAPISPKAARMAVALLFGVNFLNYIDRYVIAAVAPLIQADFSLKDTQLGLIGSMFMVAYMAASPVAGVLADRFPRRYFVGGGVLVWSLATMASGLAAGYRQLLAARSLIGLGEAGFGGVAPTLISDLFPREKRGRVLSYFYVAIPVGSALGFLLGGYVGQHWGWRHAFYIAGGPGLLLGVLAFFMAEPPRGAGDGAVLEAHKFNVGAARELARNASFVYTTLGMSAMTFALGGMAYWMPTFFHRQRGLPLDEANTVFGAMTVGSGLVGTFLGGFLGDSLLKRTPKAYLLVSGWGMLLAVPAAYVGLHATQPGVYLPAIFAAEVLVFLNTGPANAVLVNVALPEVRATAISASIFVYHLLGDVPSPILIGRLSDRTGSLESALMLTTAAMGVSGLFYLLGTRSLGADTDRVRDTVAERERRHASGSVPAA
jgi:MFS transporter, Spinster family, sphingosine-1-phosphate transporter